MMKGRTGLSLRAITLEIILYITLQSAMGLKIFKLVTLSSLGIRVRKVALRVWRTLPELHDSSTSFQTSSLRKGQQE